MKPHFLSCLIYVLLVILIIPGMTPQMASAADDIGGDSGSSDAVDTGDSDSETESSDSDSDSGDSEKFNLRDLGSKYFSWRNSDPEDSSSDDDETSEEDEKSGDDEQSGNDETSSEDETSGGDVPSDNGETSGEDDQSGNDETSGGDIPSVNDETSGEDDQSGNDETSGGDIPSDEDDSTDDNPADDGSETDDSGTGSPSTDNPETENSEVSDTSSSNSGSGSSSSSDSSSTANPAAGSDPGSTANPESSPDSGDTANPDTGSSSGSSPDSDSGSSGMGSGISTEPATNIAIKELATRNVMSGYHVKYEFPQNVTCITYIEYDAERTFRKTTTVVEVLRDKSTLVKVLPRGEVYKHVNIWVGENAAGLPTSLKNGLVGFKVEKKWMEKNNVSESFITLQWYNRGWEPLDTIKTGEDEKYVYFESETPGYSFFAITEYEGEETELQKTLRSLAGSKKDGTAREPMKAAKMLLAIALPLFLVVAGYCVLKKKI